MNMAQVQLREGIREQMEVIGSCGSKVGVIDRVEGDALKLARSEDGLHHFLPAAWVAWVVWVDDRVHLDKDVKECLSGWQPDAASCGS